jgi:drug/metabolite transporter (DMT)-like permease
VIWGSAFSLTKICYRELNIINDEVSGQLLLAGCRFFLAGGLLLLWQRRFSRQKIVSCRRDMLGMCGFGLVQTTLQYAMFYLSIGWLPGSRSSVICATNAFVSVILAHFLIKNDRLNRYKVLGCVVGLTGLVILGIGDGGTANVSVWDLLMFLSGITFSVGNIICKGLTGRLPALLVAGWQMLFGGLALCLIAWSLGAGMLHGTLLGWTMFFVLVLQSVVTMGLWSWLLKRCPVSHISVFTCLIPIIGVLFSAALLQEQVFTLSNMLSMLMVASGVFFVNYTFRSKKELDETVQP